MKKLVSAVKNTQIDKNFLETVGVIVILLALGLLAYLEGASY